MKQMQEMTVVARDVFNEEFEDKFNSRLYIVSGITSFLLLVIMALLAYIDSSRVERFDRLDAKNIRIEGKIDSMLDIISRVSKTESDIKHLQSDVKVLYDKVGFLEKKTEVVAQ